VDKVGRNRREDGRNRKEGEWIVFPGWFEMRMI
jgi:hypothetical protein